MDPQNTSTITSVVLFILGWVASYFVTKGLLTQEQANALLPEVTATVLGIGGIVLVWWKRRSHSPAALVNAATAVARTAAREGIPPNPALAVALTDAVNSSAVPGVKAVASASPSPPVAINQSGLVVPLESSA